MSCLMPLLILSLLAGCDAPTQPEQAPPAPRRVAAEGTVHWSADLSPWAVAVGEEASWIAGIDGHLVRVPREGDPEVVARKGLRADAVVVDERYVTWAEIGTSFGERSQGEYALWRLPVDGTGEPELQHEGDVTFGTLVAVPRGVAWAERGSFDGEQLAERDGAIRTLEYVPARRRDLVADSRWLTYHLVEHDGWLYLLEMWTAPRGEAVQRGWWLRRVPASGGHPARVAEVDDPGGLAVDDPWVWWVADRGPEAELWRLDGTIGFDRKKPERVATVGPAGDQLAAGGGAACWDGTTERPGILCWREGDLVHLPTARGAVRDLAIRDGRLYALFSSATTLGEAVAAGGEEAPAGSLVSWPVDVLFGR